MQMCVYTLITTHVYREREKEREKEKEKEGGRESSFTAIGKQTAGARRVV